MNWIKLAYHSFLTILLGVTLSVCSNVMDSDEFETEAIANSSNVKYGSKNVSSGLNTVTFSNDFSNKPVVIIGEDESSAAKMSEGPTTYPFSSRVTAITTNGFIYNCCAADETKIIYVAIGN